MEWRLLWSNYSGIGENFKISDFSPKTDKEFCFVNITKSKKKIIYVSSTENPKNQFLACTNSKPGELSFQII